MRALALALVLLASGAAAADETLPDPYQDALRELRMNSNAARRAWAAVGLAQGFRTAAQPGAHPKIIEALSESARLDPDPTVQAMAAYRLCLLGNATGVAPLVNALREHAASGKDAQGYFDDRVRVPVSYMYRALALVGGREVREFLVAMSSDGARGARVLAISALGTSWMNDGDIDALLRRLLNERDPAIKGAATWVLDERERNRNIPAR